MTKFSLSDSLYRFDCTKDEVSSNEVMPFENHEKSKFLMLPYAKYSYCSTLLDRAYSFICSEAKTVIILIPTYNYCSQRLMTFSTERLLQVDAQIGVDFDKLAELKEKYDMQSEDFGFEYEEILKIHIDFLREKHPELKIVPIFFYNPPEGTVREVLENNWGENSFILLSNLSCGFNYKDAMAFDSFTANGIETNHAEDIGFERFGAFRVLPEVLGFVREKGNSFIRLGLVNSGDFNENFASTAGYGAWFLYEGSSAEYVKKYYSDAVIDFVRFNLRNNSHVACSECFDFPEVFNQEFKIMVSLEKDDFVRGVSGSFKAKDALYKALVKCTFGVAFSDNRFAPVQPDEIDSLKITVTFLDEDLMNSVVITS